MTDNSTHIENLKDYGLSSDLGSIGLHKLLANLAKNPSHQDAFFNFLSDEQQSDRYQYHGEFDLDPKKINTLTDSYFKALGLTSVREKAIYDYQQKVDQLLETPGLDSRTQKKERSLDFRGPQQIAKLREALLYVDDDKIEATVDEFLKPLEQTCGAHYCIAYGSVSQFGNNPKQKRGYD